MPRSGFSAWLVALALTGAVSWSLAAGWRDGFGEPASVASAWLATLGPAESPEVPTVEPVPEPPDVEISLAAVGDVMLARGIGRRIAREADPTYPFGAMRAWLTSADVAFANLESPIGERGRPIRGKGIWFRADPSVVPLLAASGIDVVSVANNHTLDYGVENFEETLGYLEGAGIAAAGGGRSLAEALAPRIVSVRGLRVAFLGFSEFARDLYSAEGPRFEAEPDRAGVAALDPAVFEPAIRAAAEVADLVVVGVHWGTEYTLDPRPDQRRLAARMLAAGADLVLGQHPHSLQGVEYAPTGLGRKGFIAYSLGNFVFDQTHGLEIESALLWITLGRDGVRKVEIVPARIERGQPVPLEGPAARELLEKRLQPLPPLQDGGGGD